MAYLRKKIGDILIAAGLVTREQLAHALKKQSESKQRLGAILVESNILKEEDLARVLSEQLLLPRLRLSQVPIPEETLSILPRRFLVEHQIVPVETTRSTIKLAMVDPLDYVTINDVQFRTGKSVHPAIVTPTEVDIFYKGGFGGKSKSTSDVQEALRSMQTSERVEVMAGGEEGEEDILKLKQAGEAAPIVSMVNMILTEAVKSDASDVHLEPRQKDLLVRYRIDGLLRDMTTLPMYVHPSVVSRVKIMAKMDIATRRRPQDGSTKIKMGDREIDLRISTLPTLYGEKMVIRILDKNRDMMTLSDLGISVKDLVALRAFLSRPQGMLLVTGPTGSGKTTTLYASLLNVRSEGVNIITIEDPVEYQISGINQVHVNEKAGITFASGLRSLLRQDPNIIMVGEIRDRETAEIAIQASLTGHLVLSTLHTNNAVAAITRLVDIGIEPYMVASSVVGVIAQRLVRRNCPHCLESYQAEPDVMNDLHMDPLRSGSAFYRGVGCERCHHMGYQGRIGVYEVLKLDDNIRELIIERASEKRILTAARAEGMTTMEEDGLMKIADRITTPEEILRVIPPEEIVKDIYRRNGAPEAGAGNGETRAEPKIEASVPPAEAPPGDILSVAAGSAAPVEPTPATTEIMEEAAAVEQTPDKEKTDMGAVEAADVPLEESSPALCRDDSTEPVILLVESKKGNLAKLNGMLRREGHCLAVVQDGDEALRALKTKPVSVIISDIALKDMDIKELSRRGKEILPALPIMAVADGVETMGYVQEMGFDGDRIIEKPFRIKNIRVRLNPLLAAEK